MNPKSIVSPNISIFQTSDVTDHKSPLWILYPILHFVLKYTTQKPSSFMACQSSFSCSLFFLAADPFSKNSHFRLPSICLYEQRDQTIQSILPVSTAPSTAVNNRSKFWNCSYEKLYVPFFFFIGSWISGEVGTDDTSICSDSSVDTSTTVSVITSGLMAAWINSGVDTQGGTKTSTTREEKKSTGWSFYLIILM